MTRSTKKTITAISHAEAQAAAHDYARASIEKDRLQAIMNEQLSQIREEFQPKIDECDADMLTPVELLHNYSLEQRENWADKSIELSNCVIGFRLSPPSVSKKRGITWDAVVQLLKGKKTLKSFVKIKEDVDKTAILTAKADLKLIKELNSIGVTIEQDETFFVDAKKDVA